VSRLATAAAARMGARAGERYARTGIPATNPFTGKRGRDDLAAAWRRAYFGAMKVGGPE
jgi:hypothetical protein